MTFKCSDGSDKHFMLKLEKKEVKVEEYVMDMINFFNSILKQKFDFKMISYSIISLSKEIALIEWIDETRTLKGLYFL